METVLITGTTSGIGYALSELFAKKGHNLVLVSRDSQKLERQKEELSKYNISIHVISKDLSDSNAALEIYEEIKREKIVVDILVNNAGFNECGLFKDTNLQNEIMMIQVQIVTLTELTKYFVRDMVKKGGGRVLNIGSTGSFAPFPLDAVYAASKAFILNFSKAINSELKKTGVSVTTICPGATKTEFAPKAKIDNTLLFKTFVLSPNKVAEVSYRALQKRKSAVVVGTYNKLLVLFMKITPYPLLAKLTPLFLK